MCLKQTPHLFQIFSLLVFFVFLANVAGCTPKNTHFKPRNPPETPETPNDADEKHQDGMFAFEELRRAIDVGKIIHVPLARWAAWEKGPFLLFLVCRGCDVGIIISIPMKQPRWLMESIPAVFSSWLRCIGNPGFASHLFVMNGGDT